MFHPAVTCGTNRIIWPGESFIRRLKSSPPSRRRRYSSEEIFQLSRMIFFFFLSLLFFILLFSAFSFFFSLFVFPFFRSFFSLREGASGDRRRTERRGLIRRFQALVNNLLRVKSSRLRWRSAILLCFTFLSGGKDLSNCFTCPVRNGRWQRPGNTKQRPANIENDNYARRNVAKKLFH